MAFQPSEDDIQNFMAVIPEVNRQEAIARIKGNSNNVEYAINEYYEDGGNRTKYQWVDGHFSNDHEEGGYVPNNSTFNIHAPDETAPYEVRDPQTRPPTPSRRTNNRSPMTGVIDLTMEHANADPSTSINHDEDTELQRALHESRVTAGLAPQESGITGTEKVAFGPATQSQYEENEWAMVTIGKSSAQEILLDPEPAARKRDLNVPAFLKPSAGKHQLGALLTIYHEIPLLREVFLNRADVLQNYGFSLEWWSGNSVEISFMLGLEPSEGQELTYEIQRVMAFLDKTDRSYGSAEVLANLPTVKKAERLSKLKGRDSGPESAMLFAWKKIFESRETGQANKLFSIGVAGEEEADSEEFAILDLQQPTKESGLETLYDIADQLLWPHLEPDIANCAYLDHIADVITFRIREELGASENVDVPAVWYPDRYLKSGRQAALDMRLQKAEVNDELQKMHRLQDTLTEICFKGKALKVKDMFRAALKHDQEKVQDENDASPDESYVGEDEAMAQVRSEKAKKLSDDLGRLVASIDKKLQDLDLQKEKARETLRQLSKLYTEASTESDEPPTHKYTLRGVTTTNSTMYVRRRAEIDLIDMGLDSDGSQPNGDQWWKIEYASSGANPVTVEKTTEDKVLEAAKTESKNIILVYASEKAMEFESKPLPAALETFVRHDNQLFVKELTAADDTHSQESHFTSPGKRKFRTQSDAGEDANRWNGGTSPKGYENSVQVMERELRSTEGVSDLAGVRAASEHLADRVDESRTVTPGEIEPEVIHGVDPTLFGNDDSPFSVQEMQERSGIPMLAGRAGGETSTIDSMDLDQVMEDENRTEESAAVKHVELA